MTDEDILAALAEEMREARVGYYTTTAEILLPVVRRIAEQRAAEAERDRDELARQLDVVLNDLHPVYGSTSGPYGGIGGAAMTPWCHVIRPHTDKHSELVADAEDALRKQFRRAEREGYDFRAAALTATPNHGRNAT